MKRFVVGITGASGAILALRLVHTLLERGHEVHLTASRDARIVIEQELEILRQRKWGVPLKRLEIKEAAEGFAKALRGSE